MEDLYSESQKGNLDLDSCIEDCLNEARNYALAGLVSGFEKEIRTAVEMANSPAIGLSKIDFEWIRYTRIAAHINNIEKILQGAIECAHYKRGGAYTHLDNAIEYALNLFDLEPSKEALNDISDAVFETGCNVQELFLNGRKNAIEIAERQKPRVVLYRVGFPLYFLEPDKKFKKLVDSVTTPYKTEGRNIIYMVIGLKEFKINP
jgi:hypothetical protein